MSDELIEELWQIKDSIAREHGYDVDALVAHLRTQERMESRRVVDLHAAREAAEYGAPGKRADFCTAFRRDVVPYAVQVHTDDFPAHRLSASA